jgi:hypothetical protein
MSTRTSRQGEVAHLVAQPRSEWGPHDSVFQDPELQPQDCQQPIRLAVQPHLVLGNDHVRACFLFAKRSNTMAHVDCAFVAVPNEAGMLQYEQQMASDPDRAQSHNYKVESMIPIFDIFVLPLSTSIEHEVAYEATIYPPQNPSFLKNEAMAMSPDCDAEMFSADHGQALMHARLLAILKYDSKK